MVKNVKSISSQALSLLGQLISLSICYLNCICLGLKSLLFHADTVQETVKGSRQKNKIK